MAVGGLGYYNPNLNGFVEDNNPSSNELAGWMDVVKRGSAAYQRDTIDLLLHLSAKSGAYGSNWETVTTDLPDTPAMGRSVIRINTDDSNRMRLYSYNSIRGIWEPAQYGEKSMTETVTGITTVGAGTPNDYTTTEARSQHSMSILGVVGGGTFTSATVEFQISVDGTNFESLFQLEVDSSNLFDFFPFPTLAPAVKSRYNVSEITVSGGASLSVTITSI